VYLFYVGNGEENMILFTTGMSLESNVHSIICVLPISQQ